MEQLGLFDEATTRLAAARRAIARFDLDEASANLSGHMSVFPADRGALEMLEAILTLREKRDALVGTGARELDGLLGLGPSIPREFLPAWHARVATVAEGELGPGARVGGEPLGFHLVRARRYEQAIAALRATLADDPDDGRARSLLADGLFLCGQGEAARREYLSAFLDDPTGVVIDQIADLEVAGLVDSARYSYELGEPVAAWVPAVGIVERVFAPMQPRLFDETSRTEEKPAPRSFLDLMALERSARTLEARVPFRRRMKALAPLLFAAYLRVFA